MTACLPGGNWNKLHISGVLNKNPEIISINLNSQELVLSGQNLEVIDSIRLTGEESFNEVFQVYFRSSSEVIARPRRNFNLALENIFSLVITPAQGAEQVFTISFTLEGQSLDTNQLTTSSSVSEGQVLNWNGQNWVPADLNGLIYMGTWDAFQNSPNLLDYSGLPGSFYIVTVEGTEDLDGINDWKVGDWAVLNEDYEWTRIPGAGGVVSFNGRTGEVFSQAGDYVLNDLDDVDLSVAPDPNDVLSWSGTHWVASVPPSAPVTSVAGKTGAVSLVAGDITDGIFHIDRIPSSGGDLSGPLNNATVTRLQGRDLSSAAPTTDHVLTWNGASWAPAAVPAAPVTSVAGKTGIVTLNAGDIVGGEFAVAQIPSLPGSKINIESISLDRLADAPEVGGFLIGRKDWGALGPIEYFGPSGGGEILKSDPSGGLLFGKITNSEIDNGTISIAKLNTIGTAANTTVLRGDGRWERKPLNAVLPTAALDLVPDHHGLTILMNGHITIPGGTESNFPIGFEVTLINNSPAN